MQTDRAVSTVDSNLSPRVSSFFKSDPLRQRYLRIWIRLHLAQEYESRVSGDSGSPLTADERRRLVCLTLFSVWRQARDIRLRLPQMREPSVPMVERSA